MPKLMFRPPRLRIDAAGEEERHDTWLELFYDLLFAAVVAQLSRQLSADISPWGFLRFCASFVPVWCVWIGQAFYATRFDTDDLGHGSLSSSRCSPCQSERSSASFGQINWKAHILGYIPHPPGLAASSGGRLL